MIAKPIDPATGEHWSMPSIRLVEQKLWRDAEAELLAEDEEKSGGRLCADNGWKCTEVYADGKAKDGSTFEKLKVNDELSRLKHSGKDRRRRFTKKWLEFMEDPGPESALSEIVLKDDRKADIERQKAFAESTDKPEAVLIG